jgi:hypothetical protein
MEDADNGIVNAQRSQDIAESVNQSWSLEDNELLDPFAIEPRMQIVDKDRGWGFHPRAELLSGRLAMVGFAAALIMELITGQGLLQQLGLKALSP